MNAAALARHLRGDGRKGDTILAHIDPREAAMLLRAGGSGTLNPKDKLPEFFNPGGGGSNGGDQSGDNGGGNDTSATASDGSMGQGNSPTSASDETAQANADAMAAAQAAAQAAVTQGDVVNTPGMSWSPSTLPYSPSYVGSGALTDPGYLNAGAAQSLTPNSPFGSPMVPGSGYVSPSVTGPLSSLGNAVGSFSAASPPVPDAAPVQTNPLWSGSAQAPAPNPGSAWSGSMTPPAPDSATQWSASLAPSPPSIAMAPPSWSSQAGAPFDPLASAKASADPFTAAVAAAVSKPSQEASSSLPTFAQNSSAGFGSGAAQEAPEAALFGSSPNAWASPVTPSTPQRDYTPGQIDASNATMAQLEGNNPSTGANNPGNLNYAGWETGFGATPGPNGFASFPNPQQGTAALENRMFAMNGPAATEGSAINSYLGGPSTDQFGRQADPTGYAAKLASGINSIVGQGTGVMSGLSPATASDSPAMAASVPPSGAQNYSYSDAAPSASIAQAAATPPSAIPAPTPVSVPSPIGATPPPSPATPTPDTSASAPSSWITSALAAPGQALSAIKAKAAELSPAVSLAAMMKNLTSGTYTPASSGGYGGGNYTPQQVAQYTAPAATAPQYQLNPDGSIPLSWPLQQVQAYYQSMGYPSV